MKEGYVPADVMVTRVSDLICHGAGSNNVHNGWNFWKALRLLGGNIEHQITFSM